MAPRMGPESRSRTFPLGRSVYRKAGKKKYIYIHNIACLPHPPPPKFSEVELLGTASTLTEKEENLP